MQENTSEEIDLTSEDEHKRATGFALCVVGLVVAGGAAAVDLLITIVARQPLTEMVTDVVAILGAGVGLYGLFSMPRQLTESSASTEMTLLTNNP